MNTFWLGIVSALWLGILTSISPCPLASNIAAVSFIAKKAMHPALVLASGFAYALGRMLAYASLSWIIISSLFGIPQLSFFLQKYMGMALGPLLLVTGILLLEIIAVRMPSLAVSGKYQQRLAGSGAFGAFLLGIVFALALCPVSAALFFGSLIPLALQNQSGPLLPFVYGIATGLPVLGFALAIALGVTSLSRWFHNLVRIELYTRKITGVIFVAAGVYYTGVHWLKCF